MFYKCCAASFLAIGLFCAFAWANTSTETIDISGATYADLIGANSTTVDASAMQFSIPIDQFNPINGVLTSATIGLSLNYELDFNSGSNQDAGNGYTVGGNEEISGIGYADTGSSASGNGGADQSFQLKAPVTDTETISGANPAFLALIGSGQTNFTWDEEENVVVNSYLDGSADFYLSGGSLTVTYNFTPEPASLAIFCCGGLLVSRRRRRRI